MTKRHVTDASTDEEIVEAICQAGRENERGWITPGDLDCQVSLARLDGLALKGLLEKSFEWKNHSAPEAAALGNKNPGAFMVGYDKTAPRFRTLGRTR